jgi:nicotinamide-nucleotide amidase
MDQLIRHQSIATVIKLAKLLTRQGWKMATCESCTGGLLAAACTDAAGSSAWFECGFITYSNRAKQDMLGVSAKLLESDGAVSVSVAQAMVEGALAVAPIHVAVATTGLAGPSGGSAHTPIGTVCFAWITPHGLWTQRQLFPGDRERIRIAATNYALEQLLLYVENNCTYTR